MTNQPVKDKDFYLNSGILYSDKIGHMVRGRDFRQFLDRAGVLDKFTEIFMELYECPAMDYPTVEFTRKMLVVPNPDEEKMEEIKSKLADAISFRDFLKRENESLKERFKTFDPSMSVVDEDYE